MEGDGGDGVAAAIADPVRRDILVMLRDTPMTAGSIASAVPDHPPGRQPAPAGAAGSRDSSSTEVVGRERIYHLDTGPLAELDAWLAPFRSGWGPRLDALATEVARTRREHAAARTSATEPTSEERSA